MQWLLANLFIVLIVAIGAGVFFVLLYTVRLLGLSEEAERYVMIIAAILDLYLTFLITKHVHRFIDRKLYQKAHRAH